MSHIALRDNPRRKAHAHQNTAPAIPQPSASSPLAKGGFSIPEPEQKFPTLPLVLPDRCPKPDKQGITETVELYKSELGREITREEAAAILARSIRFVWALNLHRVPQQPQHKQV